MPKSQELLASPVNAVTPQFGLFAPAIEYFIDAAQRTVLFWDVMRQRGNQYREHLTETAPHVLDFDAELIADGRQLDRPVNYCLVRIIPPADVEIDPTRRPFVIVDPRAGHGPGIGGFKADSEIGVALKAGHSVLFHRVPAGPDAGPDHRGYRARRSTIPEKSLGTAPRGRWQAMRHRQLPSRLGGHDARRAYGPIYSVRSSSRDRRCHIGKACTASIRCDTREACSAAAG